MSTLPENATSKAFVASNGELAWRAQDIVEAIIAIRESGQAILGGEAWLITGSHSWDGMIPQRDGSTPGVHHWETEPRRAGESWAEYCRRTSEESIDTVRPMSVTMEDEIPPELTDRLRFNVTYVAEREA